MKGVWPLLIGTSAVVLVSLLADRKKTWKGLKTGLTMFLNLLPPFITILIIVAVLLTLLPKEMLVKLMGERAGILGYLIAAVLGSLSLIPGIIAYPLSSVLVRSGVGYPVISVFITTLMMVGVVTLPLEFRYFGVRTALLRNSLSLAGALAIGAAMGLLWGIM